MSYANAADIRRNVARLAAPIARKSVSDVAADVLRIDTPGGYSGPLDFEVAPYMREPLDLTSSRNVQAVIFCGPKQSLKTFSLIGGRIAYAVAHDPADQLLYHMSQDTGRDWSRKELKRWVESSPQLLANQSPRPKDNNTFDIFWTNGSVLKIAWPSISQVASKSVRDVLLTDYDRVQNDIGEGSLFLLASNRAEAWMSRGITIAESSPGFDVPQKHARWIRPEGTHMAPPVPGILDLFNQGDRRWWHWQCKHCREFFHAAPGVDLFRLPSNEELVELLKSYSVAQLVAQYGNVLCPHCDGVHVQADKRALNLGGRWVVEGESIDSRGEIRGEPLRSPIASFWLGGVCAVFQKWGSILTRHISGVESWHQTGDSGNLKATINTDQAMPYFPMGRTKDVQSAEVLQSMAEGWERETVPEGVRFLVLTADVQADRFVVQCIGFGPGAVIENEQRLDWWLIDRYVIKTSKRNGAPLNPAAYQEDWSVLFESLARGYALADGSGRAMHPRILGCDSGGKSGVTNNAYEFWRGVNTKRQGERVRLMKGEGKASAPRVELRYPDQRGRTDRNSSAAGDVPVLFCGSTVLKDALAGDLERCAAGDGGAHFGRGFGPEVFAELTAEYRGENGWVCPDGVRNEATDLAVYAKGLAIYLKAHEPQFWRAPPSWAQPHNTNSLVYAPSAPPAPRTPRPLMRSASNYMRR